MAIGAETEDAAKFLFDNQGEHKKALNPIK
jgi:hypothetical protein